MDRVDCATPEWEVTALCHPCSRYCPVLSERLSRPWKQRGFASAVVSTAAGSVLAACLATAFTGLTARWLGPSDRGRLVTATTTVSLVAIIAGLGVGSAARRLLVSDRQRVPFARYRAVSVILAVNTAIISGVLLMAVGGRLELSLTWIEWFCCIVFAALASYSTSLYEAMNSYGLTARSSIAVAIGAASSLAVFVSTSLVFGRGLGWALAAASAGLIVSCTYAQRRLAAPARAAAAWTGSPGGATVLVREGIKLAPFSLGQAAVLRLDRVLVAGLLGPSAAGVFSVAAALSELLRVGSLALSQRITFSSARGVLDADTVRRARRSAVTVQLVLGGLIAAALPFVVSPLLGEGYDEVAAIFPVLVLGELFLSDYLVTSRSLLGRGDSNSLSRIAVVGVVVLIALDLIMINRWGLVGASIASSGGYAFLAVASARRFRSLS